MRPTRSKFNAETGMPLTPTQLKAQPSSDLRSAFNEFLTLPVREEFARKRLAVPLFSRHEAALDLGDGANISGLDTAKDLSYNEIIQKVNTQILPLSKHIAEPKFMDAGLELGGFKVQFEQPADRKAIIGLPLFPQNFPGSIELYARIPKTMLLGRSALESAYARLKLKMDNVSGVSAPIGMHVTGMTLFHRYPNPDMRNQLDSR